MILRVHGDTHRSKIYPPLKDLYAAILEQFFNEYDNSKSSTNVTTDERSAPVKV